jgi:hypothetical protein
MSEELLRIDIDGGKYTLVQPRNEQVRIDRYGERWVGPGFPGSNCVLAMGYELEELRGRPRDFGIEANREAMTAFNNPIRSTPGVPPIGVAGVSRLLWWAGQLQMIAYELKEEAAAYNREGMDNEGSASRRRPSGRRRSPRET